MRGPRLTGHLSCRSTLCAIPSRARRVFESYEELEAQFVSGELHPGDLKAALIDVLNELLQPVRDHFAKGEAKKLLEKVKSFRITR